MHVFATNLILWIQTLMKESMEEIAEIGERHLKHIKSVGPLSSSSLQLMKSISSGDYDRKNKVKLE